MLAIPICVAVGAILFYSVRHFHAVDWRWHLLSIVAALTMCLVPIPIEFEKRGLDLIFDLVFVLLVFWGVGGLIRPGGGREKHV